MRITKYILLFLFIAFCFADCKKYPEGPWISLRTKEARVTANWDVEAFLVDGADSTSQLTCTNYSIYNKEGNHHMSAPLCSGPGISDGDWDFENHHENLLLTVELTNNLAKTPFPQIKPLISKISWEIQRLTHKELWLKTNLNGKEYYIKFKNSGKS